PRFAEDGHHRGLGLYELAKVGILTCLDADASRRAERADARLLQTQVLGFLEERFVAWIRSGPAALDVAYSEVVQAFGDAQLVLDGERDVFRLTAVAQRRVVDLDGARVAHRATSVTPSSMRA